MPAKPNIQILQQHALNKGGKLISTTYVGYEKHLTWKCDKGHIWDTSWHSIKTGSWCPTCSGHAKPDISVLQQHAMGKGGRLLSIEYKSNKDYLLWECNKGHQWSAKWNSIKSSNNWCPTCSGHAKPDISVLQQHALNKGGKLLSTEYVDNSTKMLWECDKRHQWLAKWNSIKDSNCWCPECNGTKKPDINTLQSYAINKKGKLLSTEYVDNSTKMLWECNLGHTWNASWNSIKDKNQWCSICFGNIKPNISILQQHAIDLGGKLISTNYINSSTKLMWECKKQHKWEARWADIKHNNSWCPYCSYCKTEELCRNILESNLNTSFKKQSFHYNGKLYYWDGYNEQNKIAFEYHGEQHYKYPNYFHKTEDIFKAAQQRDKNKEQWCRDNNVILLIIPYTESKNLDKYITELLYALNSNSDFRSI